MKNSPKNWSGASSGRGGTGSVRIQVGALMQTSTCTGWHCCSTKRKSTPQPLIKTVSIHSDRSHLIFDTLVSNHSAVERPIDTPPKLAQASWRITGSRYSAPKLCKRPWYVHVPKDGAPKKVVESDMSQILSNICSFLLSWLFASFLSFSEPDCLSST